MRSLLGIHPLEKDLLKKNKNTSKMSYVVVFKWSGTLSYKVYNCQKVLLCWLNVAVLLCKIQVEQNH